MGGLVEGRVRRQTQGVQDFWKAFDVNGQAPLLRGLGLRCLSAPIFPEEEIT